MISVVSIANRNCSCTEIIFPQVVILRSPEFPPTVIVTGVSFVGFSAFISFKQPLNSPNYEDDWGFIVDDPETIIVSVLLKYNFIPQRSLYSLTLLAGHGSETLQFQVKRLGMAQLLAKWIHRL